MSAAFVVPADASGVPEPVGPGKGIVDRVVWAPDGTGLVLVGVATVRIGHAGLLWVPLDGGEAVDLTAPLDRNVMPGGPEWPGGEPQFSRDGRTVVFCVRVRGRTHVYTVDVRSGGRPEPLFADPDVSVAGLSLARDADRAAVVVVTGSSHGEIAVVELPGGATRTLTAHTSAALPEVEFLAPVEREFAIGDGSTVNGWILRDPSLTGPGPLVLDVHGGPHLAWGPNAEPAHPYHQILAARGWTVLILNPRASDGYGEEFYTATLGAWGSGDEPDLLEPIDELVAEGIADPDRLAVCGYSYGGFMTCHLTTRTDRFAAAVAGGLVADLTIMAGASDESRIFAAYEFAGDVASGWEVIRAQSPYERVHQVRTPTLLLHAVNDDRCPVGQAEQWFAALRTLGVTTQLVLYPGESHQFMADGRPSNRVDYSRRIVDWLEQHVP